MVLDNTDTSLAQDVYTVQDGDTLVGISIKCNVSVARIKQYNHLYGKNKIYFGQVIRLKPYTDITERPFKMLADCHRGSSFKEKERLRASTASMKSYINKMPQLSSDSVEASSCGSEISVTVTEAAQPLKSISSFRYKAISDPNLSDKANCGKLKIEDEIHIFPRRRITYWDNVCEYSDDETESVCDYDQFTDMEFSSSPSSSVDLLQHQLHLPPSVQIQNANSSILSNRQVGALARRLPASLQLDSWVPLYSLQLHGADLNSFYQCAKGHKYTLLVVRAEDGSAFGGFGSEPWRPQRQHMFYGGGECFLFRTLSDSKADDVEVFDWKFENYFFMWSSHEQVAMGGGGGQFGFVLDPDFLYGETNPCDTFGNPRLTPHILPFKISDVELWGFESFINTTSACGGGYREAL